MKFFIKNQRTHYIGRIIVAFGVLFVGLNSMSQAMKPLAKSDAFANLLLQIKDMPVVGLVVGSLITMIVQSSSAAIGVLQTLSGTAADVTDAPLVADSGSGNAGMLTPLTVNMREAIAMSYTVFNVIKSLLWLPLIWLMVKNVTLIVPGEDPIVHRRLAYFDCNVIHSPSRSVGQRPRMK